MSKLLTRETITCLLWQQQNDNCWCHRDEHVVTVISTF